MKKKNEITPLEQFKIFKSRLFEDARVYNVTSDRNVEASLNVLMEALNKAIFDLENPVPEAFQKKLAQSDNKKFIAIYKAKFLEAYDTENIEHIDGSIMNMIDIQVGKIHEKGGTINDYLNFFFDEYLPANKTMLANIKLSISIFALQQYFISRASTFKKQKDDDVRNKLKVDLYNRFRILVRVTDKKDIRMNAWLLEYQHGDMTLEELRDKIVAAEEKYKDLLVPNVEANII